MTASEPHAEAATEPLLRSPVADATVAKSGISLAKEVYSTGFTRPAKLVTVGLLVISASVLYGIFAHTKVMLFTWHPFFNIIGLYTLVRAITIVQPTSITAAHKEKAGQIHGIMNTIASLSFLAGYSAIYYNKHLHNAQHITSWHATFGLATYLFLWLETIFGILIFFVPQQIFGSVAKAKSFYKYHRLCGYIIILLISITILLALQSDFNVNALHISYATIVPGLILVLGGLTLQIQTSKMKVL